MKILTIGIISTVVTLCLGSSVAFGESESVLVLGVPLEADVKLREGYRTYSFDDDAEFSVDPYSGIISKWHVVEGQQLSVIEVKGLAIKDQLTADDALLLVNNSRGKVLGVQPLNSLVTTGSVKVGNLEIPPETTVHLKKTKYSFQATDLNELPMRSILSFEFSKDRPAILVQGLSCRPKKSMNNFSGDVLRINCVLGGDQLLGDLSLPAGTELRAEIRKNEMESRTPEFQITEMKSSNGRVLKSGEVSCQQVTQTSPEQRKCMTNKDGSFLFQGVTLKPILEKGQAYFLLNSQGQVRSANLEFPQVFYFSNGSQIACLPGPMTFDGDVITCIPDESLKEKILEEVQSQTETQPEGQTEIPAETQPDGQNLPTSQNETSNSDTVTPPSEQPSASEVVL